METRLYQKSQFDRIRDSRMEWDMKLRLIADMCRFNALNAVKRAGSGHLGTSFSSMELFIYLYFRRMKFDASSLGDPSRDVYFSSKGHDAPGLYAVLYALGIIPEERLLKLRRFGGLDGHPDVKIPGVEANSGSLGMGISKAKGIALAKRKRGLGGHVYVLTGDGELQEGQNYEGLQSAAFHRVENMTVLIDNNRLQSDRLVSEIMPLGDISKRVTAFGCEFLQVDGHDFSAIEKCFAARDRLKAPTVIQADTIKGAGVSFMEHPEALRANNGFYKWHSGAPDNETFLRAAREIESRVSELGGQAGLVPEAAKMPDHVEVLPMPEFLMGEPDSIGDLQAYKKSDVSKSSSEFVAAAYGEELERLMKKHAQIVVLDADLSADCRLRSIEDGMPDRFVELGIAEQDMVSTAGGMARHGFLPVVNSFASFLASRANEQIYNNVTEGSRVIYGCHFGGLVPAGPGKSHQSVRDISLFASLPNMAVIQPCSASECAALLRFAVERTKENIMFRMNIGPSPRVFDGIKSAEEARAGWGVRLRDGKDAALIGYGPVLLNEAMSAAEELERDGISVAVWNHPWLNRVEDAFLESAFGEMPRIITLDDHATIGGLGDRVAASLIRIGWFEGKKKVFQKIGVDGLPACGTPTEALRYHGLDGSSLALRIRKILKG